MTATASTAAPVARPARPVWSRLGGGGVTAAGSLLFVATILEYFYVTSDDPSDALLVPFVITFSLSLLVYLAAAFPLAFGAHGDDGIVGSSVAGKAGFIGFGVFILAAQMVYLLSNYFTEPDSDFAAANAASLVLIGLQYLSALVAAVVVMRAGVATGFARWSLLAMLMLGIACGIVAQTGSFEVLTAAYLVSTAAQVVVGVSYLTAGARKPAVQA